MVLEFNKCKNTMQIKNLIETFATQFCISKDGNKRKGGLIALASCGVINFIRIHDLEKQ